MAYNYDFWKRKLAWQIAPYVHGAVKPEKPVNEDPQPGWYRSRDTAAVIWISNETGELKCKINGAMVDRNTMLAQWQSICDRAVSTEDYKARIESGRWPGENAVVTEMLSNNAPEDDSFEGIHAAIDRLADEAKRLMKGGAALTKAAADEAADVADKLGKLYAKAEKARKIEKQPFIDGGKRVDDKWSPLTTVAGIYKMLKDTVVEPFLLAQKRAKEAAERKAQAEADRLRREAAEKEAEARRMIAAAAPGSNTTAVADAERIAADAAARAETAAATAMEIAATPVTAGTRGRKTSLRTVTVVTIEDRAQVLEFFKHREEITALLQSMAEKAVDAGFAVPGVKVSKDQDAA